MCDELKPDWCYESYQDIGCLEMFNWTLELELIWFIKCFQLRVIHSSVIQALLLCCALAHAQ